MSSRPTSLRSILLNDSLVEATGGNLAVNGIPVVSSTGYQEIQGHKLFKAGLSTFTVHGENEDGFAAIEVNNRTLMGTDHLTHLDWEGRILHEGPWSHYGTPILADHLITKKYADNISGILNSGVSDVSGRLATISGSQVSLSGTMTSRDNTISGMVTSLSGTFTTAHTALSGRLNTLSGHLLNVSGLAAAGGAGGAFPTGEVCLVSPYQAFNTIGTQIVIGRIPTGYIFYPDSCEVICHRTNIGGTIGATLFPTAPAVISFGWQAGTNYTSSQGNLATGIEFQPITMGARYIENIPHDGCFSTINSPITIGAYVNRAISGVTSGTMSGLCVVRGYAIKI